MIIKEVPAEGNLTIEVSLKERKLEFHSQCVELCVNLSVDGLRTVNTLTMRRLLRRLLKASLTTMQFVTLVSTYKIKHGQIVL